MSVPDDILAEAEGFVPEYKQVTGVSPAADSGWQPASQSAPDPDPEEYDSVDQQEILDIMAAQKSIGTDAEQAALHEVTERSEKILSWANSQETIETPHGPVDSAWDVLQWPIPEGGVTANSLETARQDYEADGGRQALQQELHIASVWDGAGYDLLGLDWETESERTRVVPVRYEIKAISAVDPEVSLHLTGKQLSVQDAVHDPSTDDIRYAGDWRLWGVEIGDDAFNFTEQLTRLPESAIEELHRRGFDHDGLILNVVRGDADDTTTLD